MSPVDLQTTIFGGLVPMQQGQRVRMSRPQGLVVRWMATHGGEIRSTRAGVILHVQREHGCPRGAYAASDRWTPGPNAGACCCWAASDGWALLRRLEKRGIVEKVERGRWRLTKGDA